MSLNEKKKCDNKGIKTVKKDKYGNQIAPRKRQGK
jgi:hypothetical protein